MSLPDVSQRAWAEALPPAASGTLAAIASASVPEGTLSGFSLLASGSESLQARLALIERAQVSLDLQYYQFKGDATGRRLMRALHDAAARGVRVRVLLDDLYTTGDDALWLGLAAAPHIEVRLFNPFLAGRESQVGRLAESALGNERMHRRMHNKMLIADGVLAIAGGRNIADAYFLAAAQGSFVDIDVLAAGALLPSMMLAFDLYWNSDFSHELRTVVEEPLPPVQRQAALAAALAADGESPAGAALRLAASAASGVMRGFEQGRLTMHTAVATVVYDSPAKVESEPGAVDPASLAITGAQVPLLVGQAIRQARQEVWIVSPYLIPGNAGLMAIREMRERGVRITLLTNSLAATDEAMVHLGYRKYRVALLREGVELYEWSAARGGRVLREWLAGGPVLRLHAKAALIDRSLVYLGSMNFDPRSRQLNTEFGLLIRSPALAEDVHALVEQLKRESAFRLRLADDGRTLRWTAGDGDVPAQDFEPDTDFGSRLLLDLLEPLVPEELL